MNKLFFILFSVISLCNISVYASYCNHMHDDNEIYGESAIEISLAMPEKSSLLDKYLRSLVPGLLVGAGIGGVSAFFDHIAPDFWALTWFIAFWQRKSFVDDISLDMQRHNLPHHKAIMELSSVVASWLTYYKVYQEIHGCRPF